MDVGERIRKEREKIGMSQTKLASICKVTKQTIYKYEKGIVTNIPLDTLKRIAEALNVSAAYLMGLEQEESAAETLADIFSELYSDPELQEVMLSLIQIKKNDANNFKNISALIKGMNK